jgi:hypothetical protein
MSKNSLIYYLELNSPARPKGGAAVFRGKVAGKKPNFHLISQTKQA